MCDIMYFPWLNSKLVLTLIVAEICFWSLCLNEVDPLLPDPCPFSLQHWELPQPPFRDHSLRIITSYHFVTNITMSFTKLNTLKVLSLFKLL